MTSTGAYVSVKFNPRKTHVTGFAADATACDEQLVTRGEPATDIDQASFGGDERGNLRAGGRRDGVEALGSLLSSVRGSHQETTCPRLSYSSATSE